MRPTINGKTMALDGDRTTTGATCIATVTTATCNGKQMLRVGDSTTPCPKCKQQGVVATGEKSFITLGQLQAIDGSIVQCGCSYGSNKVIAGDAPVQASTARFLNTSPEQRTTQPYGNQSPSTSLSSPVVGNQQDKSKDTERVFIAKEYPIGNPKDPFEKSQFELEMQERLNHSDKFNFPDQGDTSLCGPAALFYCLLRDRPDTYECVARELWQYGRTQLGQLTITPSEGCRHPAGSFYRDDGQARVSGLDWVTLASLRDSENIIMSYSEVDDQIAGITDWWSLSDWFEKAGYQKVFSNTSLSHSNLQDILTLNDYYNQGYTVVSLISAGMLEGYSYGDDSSFKNHWIVWAGNVKENNKNGLTIDADSTAIVNLNAFSWGVVEPQVRQNKTLEYFLKHTFGALVFKRIS